MNGSPNSSNSRSGQGSAGSGGQSGNRGGRNQGQTMNRSLDSGSNSSGRGSGGRNAQAGRPQDGSSQPQLSGNTRKKMQNAGMDSREPQSVADSQEGIEELKSQNEQIIELLKRINDSLNR